MGTQNVHLLFGFVAGYSS